MKKQNHIRHAAFLAAWILTISAQTLQASWQINTAQSSISETTVVNGYEMTVDSYSTQDAWVNASYTTNSSGIEISGGLEAEVDTLVDDTNGGGYATADAYAEAKVTGVWNWTGGSGGAPATTVSFSISASGTSRAWGSGNTSTNWASSEAIAEVYSSTSPSTGAPNGYVWTSGYFNAYTTIEDADIDYSGATLSGSSTSAYEDGDWQFYDASAPFTISFSGNYTTSSGLTSLQGTTTMAASAWSYAWGESPQHAYARSQAKANISSGTTSITISIP